MTQKNFREFFPQLRQTVYGKPLVYLDNAATSLRPQSVVEKWNEMSLIKNANLHRAVHYTAEVATREYEEARLVVADNLNADSKEIIFTSGTTQSINLLAFSFGESFVGKGDEIVVAESEHHSDIVPWQMMCQRKGAILKMLPVGEDGSLLTEKLEKLLTSKTKLVCVAHISNVLGMLNPIKEIVEICHSKNCLVFVDGAQGVVHTNVDVKNLGCDFYAFSGHKIYCAPGTGVLYGKKALLEMLPPYMGGGEMIDSVSFEKTTYATVPQKFEAGTQNIAGVPTFKPAFDIHKIASEEGIRIECDKVKEFVYQSLVSRKELTLYGTTDKLEKKVPVFSFTVSGVHHEDLALILDKMGVAVRSGQMCAEPLMTKFGVTGMVRASFAPYNTMEEAEYFIQSLDKTIQMLR